MTSAKDSEQDTNTQDPADTQPKRRIPVGLTEEEIDDLERYMAEIEEDLRQARIPGESEGWSVYKILFEDGCDYYAHTSNIIAWKVETLCNPEHQDAIPFLVLHDQQMPKALICLASGLSSGGQALGIRNQLIRKSEQEPEEICQGGTAPDPCPINKHLQDLHFGAMRQFHQTMHNRYPRPTLPQPTTPAKDS